MLPAWKQKLEAYTSQSYSMCRGCGEAHKLDRWSQELYWDLMQGYIGMYRGNMGFNIRKISGLIGISSPKCRIRWRREWTMQWMLGLSSDTRQVWVGLLVVVPQLR